MNHGNTQKNNGNTRKISEFFREFPSFSVLIVNRMVNFKKLLAASLLMMMAQVTGLKPGDFIHTTGDTHLYLNHMEQVRLQLTRTPRPLPTMRINPDVKSLFDFRYEDFSLENYDPYPHIAGEVAV